MAFKGYEGIYVVKEQILKVNAILVLLSPFIISLKIDSLRSYKHKKNGILLKLPMKYCQLGVLVSSITCI